MDESHCQLLVGTPPAVLVDRFDDDRVGGGEVERSCKTHLVSPPAVKLQLHGLVGGQVSGGIVGQGGRAWLGPPPDGMLHLHDFACDQVLVMRKPLHTEVVMERPLDTLLVIKDQLEDQHLAWEHNDQLLT